MQLRNMIKHTAKPADQRKRDILEKVIMDHVHTVQHTERFSPVYSFAFSLVHIHVQGAPSNPIPSYQGWACGPSALCVH